MNQNNNIHLSDRRVVIIVGHYGSGKTEFAINYAIKKAEQFRITNKVMDSTAEKTLEEIYNKPVFLADLDIVNLYFRSTEVKTLLESNGVSLIESTVSGGSVDLPSLKANLHARIQDKKTPLILDVGGNGVGAKILQQYQKNLQPFDYDMFLTINANRPETKTLENVMHFLYNIEGESGLRVTGLINNTHLLKETSIADIKKGHSLVQEVADKTGLPVRYECAPDFLVREENTQSYFPLTLYMRTDWMV